MKHYLLGCLAACSLLSAASTLAAPFDELLPGKGTEGHVMTLTFSERMKELSVKMAAAYLKNKEWFIAAGKQGREGQPMPYDERMGVSREEYEEYLSPANRGQLKEVRAVKFDLIENPDGSYSLDAGPSLPMLKEVKFDSKRGVIATPYGILKDPKEVTITEKGYVMGPWKGFTYHLSEGTYESLARNIAGKVISLTVGRQTENGHRFLTYRASVLENGTRTTDFDITVMYD
jgi:hypothetical protein